MWPLNVINYINIYTYTCVYDTHFQCPAKNLGSSWYFILEINVSHLLWEKSCTSNTSINTWLQWYFIHAWTFLFTESAWFSESVQHSALWMTSFSYCSLMKMLAFVSQSWLEHCCIFVFKPILWDLPPLCSFFIPKVTRRCNFWSRKGSMMSFQPKWSCVKVPLKRSHTCVLVRVREMF